MSRNIVLLIILCTAIPAGLVLAEGKPPTWEPTPEERADRPWIPLGPNEVGIGVYGASMPLGRILLARKGPEYCALKFTNTWLGETQYDHYTSYEFYYQNDGSGDFSKSTAVSGTDELFFPKVRSFLGVPYQKGAKNTIQCGGIKFKWLYIADISIDDGEFAPTPWTSITDVNVRDPRIQWYRKDKSRKAITVHIDHLWNKPGAGEGQP